MNFKKLLVWGLCVAMLALAACTSPFTPISPSAASVPTITVDSGRPAMQTPVRATALKPTPTALPVTVTDGPSILDGNYMVEYGDLSHVYYSVEDAVPMGADPQKQVIEAEAVELCEKYFDALCISLTSKEEADLSPLYDLTTQTRMLDWKFNQMYMYSELLTKTDVDVMTYDGSTFIFNWNEWSMEANNGVLVVFTKSGFKHHNKDINENEKEDRATVIQYGDKNGKNLTNEFALTRVGNTLKIIRYRNYDFNYVALQQRLIDNPELADNLDDFRKYIDTMANQSQ